MTLSQIRTDIWRGLGEPTFWDPASADAAIAAILTRVANEGQRQVAMHKTKRGRHVRHRNLINTLYYSPTNFTDTVATVSNTTFPYSITVDGDNVGANNDRYNGWLVEMTSGDADGQVRLIHDFTGATNTLYYGEAFTSDPAADDTIKMYKNFELLLPSTHDWVGEHISLPATSDLSRATGNLIEVLSIVDIEKRYKLKRAYKAERFDNNFDSPSDPTMWRREGMRLYYDYPVDDDKVLELTYYRTPTDMSEDTDEPEIEEQFHYGIVLWGLMWGYLQLQESSKKYSVKRDFQDFMQETINQWDVQFEIGNPKGTIKIRSGGN